MKQRYTCKWQNCKVGKDRSNDYPEDDGAVHFMNVGRIMKEKGMDEYFYAIRKIKKEYPETTFEFIGWYEDDYKDIVEKMQAEETARQNTPVAKFVKAVQETATPAAKDIAKKAEEQLKRFGFPGKKAP